MKNRGTVCGVGINDADYIVEIMETTRLANGKSKQKRSWICPFYATWLRMLYRGYNKKQKELYPTYKDCCVCKEWHLFSTFKSWMEQQDWEGNVLDKDLLVRGNKIYSPETCVFVSAQVNSFILDSAASRGPWLIGVYWDKRYSKFVAQCCNPFTKGRDYLGSFDSELEVHKAWLKRKLEHANSLASIQTNAVVSNALIDKYNNFIQ